MSLFFGGGKNNNAQRNVGNFALCRFHSTHIALRTFLSDELIRTHLFRIPADNMTFFSLQKLKRSRKVCLMRRDIAWRHHQNEKGLRYAVASLGMVSCHVVRLFIYGCACINIADLRWRNEYVVIIFGCHPYPPGIKCRPHVIMQ